MNYLVSATISFTVSVVFNYLASMRYVFTHKEDMSRRREFVIFIILSVIGLLINNVCMWAGVELPPRFCYQVLHAQKVDARPHRRRY